MNTIKGKASVEGYGRLCRKNLVISCKLCYSHVIWKKAKQYFCQSSSDDRVRLNSANLNIVNKNLSHWMHLVAYHSHRFN